MRTIQQAKAAIRHGQIVIAGGKQFRIVWEYDNSLLITDFETNRPVDRAKSQTELQLKLARLGRAA